MGYFSPREIKKKLALVGFVFIIFCIKIALVTNSGPHGIIFAPPPKVLEKKWAIFMYIIEEYLLSLLYF